MMGEWASYGLGDFLMYSPRAWYRMLALHNQAWWPMQVVAAVLGMALAVALLLRLRQALRLGLVLTGAGLLFVAWAFHAGPHAGINLAAPYFAVVFAAQGALLLGAAALWPAAPPASDDGARVLVLALWVVAVLLYPLMALAQGRPLAQAECFLLTPDPTMLAALAMVVWLYRGQASRRGRAAGALLAILPLAWCTISGLTLWTLGAGDWWPMPAAALLAIAAAFWPQARPLAA